MYDFMTGAAPFVIIGLCLAILFANFRQKRGGQETGNYLTEGMCLGMCIGVAFSTSLGFDLGLGISLGMLIGETAGLFIQKK